MNTYTFTLPASASPDDCVFAGVANSIIPKPDQYTIGFDGTNTSLILNYNSTVLTPTQQTNFQTLCNTNPHPANTPWARNAILQQNLAGVPTILRNQVAAAQPFVPNGVTAGNVVNITQSILNDLVVFAARLADLIESLGIPA